MCTLQGKFPEEHQKLTRSQTIRASRSGILPTLSLLWWLLAFAKSGFEKTTRAPFHTTLATRQFEGKELQLSGGTHVSHSKDPKVIPWHIREPRPVDGKAMLPGCTPNGSIFRQNCPLLEKWIENGETENAAIS